MKKCNLLSLVILTLIPLAGLSAGPVKVKLHQPPPGQLSLEHLWWVDLNNTTRETFRQVWLHGEVHEARQGLVFKANSNKFDLSPGRRTIRLRDISIKDPWYKPGYQAFYTRTGQIPEGDYTYSVTLEPDLGGDTSKAKVRHPGPPRLISPRDRAELPESQKYPVFSWTRPMPPVGQVTYELKLVEVLAGQTREEALRANQPWFEKEGMATTTLRYPTSARALKTDKEYAWQVTAFSGRTEIGQSEVWNFSFQVEDTTLVLPYSWDVETRRTLSYRLTVSETEGADTLAVFSSDVELRVTGNGAVKLAFSGFGGHARQDPDAAGRTTRQDSAPGPHYRLNQETGRVGFGDGRAGERPPTGSRPGAPASYDYTMSPSGMLAGDEPAALFLSHYSFEVLPEESVAVGDTWTRLHSRLATTQPLLQRQGSDTFDLKLTFQAVTINAESVAVSLTGLWLLPADSSSMDWRRLLSGAILFDPVDRCTERSSYTLTMPDVEADPLRVRAFNVSLERQRNQE